VFFFAYHRDEFIVCEPTLAQVLAILADIRDPMFDEDVAVWAGPHCVCVVASGRVVWLRPEFKPATVAA
jgi:hypothetical protein